MKKSLYIILLLSTLLIIIYGPVIDIEHIIHYTPENQILTVIFILIIFLIKSLTIFFPIAFVYVITGLLFNSSIAILINIIGISLSLAYSYWLGYKSEGRVVNKLINKYEKAEQLDELMKDNECVSVFIARIIGVIPSLISTTLIGITIKDPFSIEFILSILLRISISGIAILLAKRRFA